jgi:hypothetical protein
MTPPLWVFRRPGRDSGSPDGGYDEQAFLDRLPELIRRIRAGAPEPLEYDQAAGTYTSDGAFAVAELFRAGRLRQGWGVDELAMARPNGIFKSPEDWHMDYLFALWKYWTEIPVETVRGGTADVAQRLAPHMRHAAGRYGILRRMLMMRAGHIVFVPRTSEDPGDNESFSVARVARGYAFEPRDGQPPGTWLRDYGHVIEVSDVRSFSYSDETLRAADFQAYRTAVNGPVEGNAEQRFRQFLVGIQY